MCGGGGRGRAQVISTHLSGSADGLSSGRHVVVVYLVRCKTPLGCRREIDSQRMRVFAFFQKYPIFAVENVRTSVAKKNDECRRGAALYSCSASSIQSVIRGCQVCTGEGKLVL